MRRSIRLALTTVLASVLALGSAAAAHPLGAQESQIRTFPARQGSRVEVSVTSSEVRVTVWKAAEIQVVVVGADPQHFSVQQTGSVVRVQDNRRWGWRDARLEIRVPSRIDLDLQTRSGEIEVRGDVIGNVSIRTSAGDIRVGSIEGRLYAATSGGDIEMGHLKGNGDVKTSGGDIDCRDIEGNFEAKTSGGHIRLGDVSGSLEAKTSGGGIEVGAVGADADLKTSGGDVEVRSVAGRASLRTSGGDIVLSGSAGPTQARTSGGDVELNRIQAPSEVRTAGGDIEVGLAIEGNPAGESRIATRGGEIVLRLEEGTRATIEARIEVKGRWEQHEDDYKIDSDFEAASMQRDPKSGEVRARFEINGGGHRIVLETSNGDIIIRRGRL
ncbi:MAG: DUF4097 family beta strand repeat-containing protein [Acidobacteriota bacterium]